MGAIDRFEKLNARQREAACFGAGPLLIIAGAGTGKTNTLAHRVAHLILKGCAPEQILLLTFSRRAAVEMTRRARRVVGAAMATGMSADVRLPWSGTFHSIANRLLRTHSSRIGLEPSFSVLDRADAADLMDVARHELGYSKAERRFPRKDTCLAVYSHVINRRGTLKETLDTAFPWCVEWETELQALYRAYVEKKLASQALDYDDLLLYWHAMLADERLARDIGGAFEHVLVDEYQDTNGLQAEHPRAAQARRRGCDGSRRRRAGDLLLPRRHRRKHSVLCEKILAVWNSQENYRSTQAILDAANALMRARTCAR